MKTESATLTFTCPAGHTIITAVDYSNHFKEPQVIACTRCIRVFLQSVSIDLNTGEVFAIEDSTWKEYERDSHKYNSGRLGTDEHADSLD